MSEALLNVVVIFHNGIREARRTLYTLSAQYQLDILEDQYVVNVIDSNSTEILGKKFVESFGKNFFYEIVESPHPSPAMALNVGYKKHKLKYVMLMIDGARLLTPKILSHALKVFKALDDPMPYTNGYDIGNYKQNDSMTLGYNQIEEDRLFESVDWKKNGYELFNISNYAQRKSMFNKVIESNCFAVETKVLESVGGFDERFISPGGGLLNLEVFKQLIEKAKLKPVCLIGEASFHQFHGGVSTNVERWKHPIHEASMEYYYIKGKHYSPPQYFPFYWGSLNNTFNKNSTKIYYDSYLIIIDLLVKEKLFTEAERIADFCIKQYPFELKFHLKKIRILILLKKYSQATISISKAEKLDFRSIPLLLLQAELYEQTGFIQNAINCFEEILGMDSYEPRALYGKYKLFTKLGNTVIASEMLECIISSPEKLRGAYPAFEILQVLIKRNELGLARKIIDSVMFSEPENLDLKLQRLELEQLDLLNEHRSML